MWQFAAGLYLVSLADGVLRLAAILGFTGGGLILLLGGVIGNWVDENPRLKGRRVAILIREGRGGGKGGVGGSWFKENF